MKKQGELIPHVTKPDISEKPADNPVLCYPFKISGRDMGKFLHYSMQKYLQAMFEKIPWSQVSYRDLAGVFINSAGRRHRKLRVYKLRDANWAGQVIKKKFLCEPFVEKENFICVAVEFCKCYEKEYMDGGGLNWNFINEHEQKRKEILDKIKNKVKSESIEDRPVFF